MNKPLCDEDGYWYAWGESLSHNSLSMLTRVSYRCGCRLLTANGGTWSKWEDRCNLHLCADKPHPHVWVNQF
jgi:hypothetical protein